MSVSILTGDCIDEMRKMSKASVDAIVTDPPYGLAFMGKEWDTHEPRAFQQRAYEWGLEMERVLKPGGYLLAFGGTRTYHRLACGLEDAGFEIRDSIHWVYGSGFPKSLDVSKALDALDAAAARRERALTFTAWMRSTGITAAAINEATESCMASHYLSEKEQPAVATPAHFDKLRPLLPPVPAEIEALVADRVVESENLARREVVGTHERNAQAAAWRERYTGEAAIEAPGLVTRPYTPLARRHAGLGTALKPAHEPIVLARKRLAGTVAATVAKFGTGALNVDASRVDANGDSLDDGRISTTSDGWDRPWKHDAEAIEAAKARGAEAVAKAEQLGRWPPNLLLSHAPECVEGGKCAEDCAVAEMDRQSGETSSNPAGVFATGQPAGWSGGTKNIGRTGSATRDVFGYGDSGGASRFFPVFRYEAKPSRAEREAGLTGETRQGGGHVAQSDGKRMGRTAEEGANTRDLPRVRNTHPTVKPAALMAWLVQLVTPKGGTVLDPFLGSGTTAIACQRLGIDCIGIEKEAEYVAIAEARIKGDAPLFHFNEPVGEDAE